MGSEEGGVEGSDQGGESPPSLLFASFPFSYPFLFFSSSLSLLEEKTSIANCSFFFVRRFIQLKTKEPLLQTELASLRKQKLELDAASNPTHSGTFSSSNTNINAAYPAPSNFAPPTTTNGAVVEQKEEKMEEEPVGDGMMDVEGDEDVEY